MSAIPNLITNPSEFPRTPVPFYYTFRLHNGKQQQAGDDTGYDTTPADEQLDNPHCDPLVNLEGQIPIRFHYYDTGLFPEKLFLLRKPALELLQQYSKYLEEEFGWKVQVWDPYRSPKNQRSGAIFGTKEKLKLAGRTEEWFVSTLQAALNRQCPKDEQRAKNELALLTSIASQAHSFFGYPNAKKTNYVPPDGLNPLLLRAGASYEVSGLEIDPYSSMAHASGGVADIEWVFADTGIPVNVGTRDTADAFGMFPYFEDHIPDSLVDALQKPQLKTFEGRMEYYRQAVQNNASLRQYLLLVGVDPDELIQNDQYLKKVCLAIQENRRIAAWTGLQFRIFQYVYETWHADLHDGFGGIRFKKTGIVSGGGGYAVYSGQERCAWGCAFDLYSSFIKDNPHLLVQPQHP